MSLTRDERNKLTDLILQSRARTLEAQDAERKERAAEKALSEYVESLSAIVVTQQQCSHGIPLNKLCAYCSCKDAELLDR